MRRRDFISQLGGAVLGARTELRDPGRSLQLRLRVGYPQELHYR
jgi:hypothetical protein